MTFRCLPPLPFHLPFPLQTVSLVHSTVGRLDGDQDGLITCDEFVAGFAAGDPTADTSAMAAMVPGQQELVIPLQRIPELYASAERQGMTAAAGGARGARGPVVSFSSAELSQFAAALTPCVQTQPVARASSARTLSPTEASAPLTVVQPAMPGLAGSRGGAAPNGALLVPIGHYAGAEAPPSAMRLLELRDKRGDNRGDASVRLQAALDQVMPPPARYQLVWSRAEPAPLSIWAAVPPTQDFVAVGMVATATTSSSQRPELDLLRCVPKAWTRRVTAEELVHESSEGTVWRSNLGLLHASKGRNPPYVYELVSEEFSLG